MQGRSRDNLRTFADLEMNLDQWDYVFFPENKSVILNSVEAAAMKKGKKLFTKHLSEIKSVGYLVNIARLVPSSCLFVRQFI